LSIYSIIIQKIIGKMAYNVPAVCDVFAVAMGETAGFQQPQKCGGVSAWEPLGDLAETQPAAGAHTGLLCDVKSATKPPAWTRAVLFLLFCHYHRYTTI
jgi:hypothetical protein